MDETEIKLIARGPSRIRKLRQPAIVVVARAVSIGLLIARGGDAFEWTREQRNAGAIQALAAIATLLATTLLLLVTWTQANAAKSAVAEARRSTDEARLIAEHEVELARKSLDESRKKQFQSRRDDKERLKHSIMPMISWWDPKLPETTRVFDRIEVSVGNVGLGAARSVRLFSGNGLTQIETDQGYTTFITGRDRRLIRPLHEGDREKQHFR